MRLTKKEINELSAMQLCSRLTRLQFNEEADGLPDSERREAVKLEKELRKRLALALQGSRNA